MEGMAMPKFLIEASYSQSGVQGVLKDGASGRKAAVKKVVASAGGKLESFHFAFGETDVYIIVDLPDNTAAVALAAAVASSGALSRYVTVPLLSDAEVDAAASVAVKYRAPGA
jgi:uncharacterized protein with GYD domain